MQEEHDRQSQVEKETLEFVTPYALTIRPSLIGTPLAKPWKRLLALGIDIVLIAFLSSMNVVFLALVFVVLFFYVGSGKRSKGLVFPKVFSVRRRKLIRVAFWMTGFLTLIGLLTFGVLLLAKGDNIIFKESDGWEMERLVAVKDSMRSYQVRLKKADCQTPECLETLMQEIRQDLKQLGLRTEIENIVMDGIREKAFEANQPANSVGTKVAGGLNPSEEVEAKVVEPVLDPESMDDLMEIIAESEPAPRTSYSILGWGKGIMSDLGVGIGWSSLYFTLFVSWWKGQTPGKKLMRLRVIQLNNAPISLWESFGRYGGYAAGLSTGLLGFLQVFWDPNRQAIQDKISATIVIDLAKSKKVGDAALEKTRNV